MTNRTTPLALIAGLLVIISVIYFYNYQSSESDLSTPPVNQPDSDQTPNEPEPTSGTDLEPGLDDQPDDQSPQPSPTAALNGKFSPPLDNHTARVLHKSFGTYVDPATSPVQPEKFRGYHAGTDFEILDGEENAVVNVYAICDGRLAIKRSAQGYGGLVAQYCTYNGEPVLVLYGHVALSSVDYNLNDEITTGQVIGRLGQPGPETDGERKHLHLGIRRGHSLVVSGYVQSESALSAYLDPMSTFR